MGWFCGLMEKVGLNMKILKPAGGDKIRVEKIIGMNISDLREALSVAPHLDFILFDACFMQSVEVLYELKEYANYIIGSPTEIPAPGAPYQKVVPAMLSNTTTAVGIGKAYFEFYVALSPPVYGSHCIIP